MSLDTLFTKLGQDPTFSDIMLKEKQTIEVSFGEMSCLVRGLQLLAAEIQKQSMAYLDKQENKPEDVKATLAVSVMMLVMIDGLTAQLHAHGSKLTTKLTQLNINVNGKYTPEELNRMCTNIGMLDPSMAAS
jgi:hypothetical protein